MELSILKLIYEYSIRFKPIDKDFVEKLVGTVVDKKQLQDYVKVIHYDLSELKEEYGKVRVASYNVLDRVISVNIDAMNEYLLNFDERYGDIFNNHEQLFYKNELFTQAILHELEHANQNKKYNVITDEGNTEKILIEMALRTSYNLKDPKKFLNNLMNNGCSEEQIMKWMEEEVRKVKMFYDINPIERLAEIRSYDTLANSLNPLSSELPNLCGYMYFNYINSLISGYEYDGNQLIAPTVAYINGMKFTDEWPRFTFYDGDPKTMVMKLNQKHTLIERLSLGLPISFEEHEKVNKQLILYSF